MAWIRACTRSHGRSQEYSSLTQLFHTSTRRKFASEDDKRAMRIPENLRNVPRLSRKEVAQLEALLGQRETTRQLHPRLVRRLQQTTAAASAMEAKKSDK